MGIKGFSAWLRITFPQAFCPIPTIHGNGKLQVSAFDQIYVDLNPFLHLAARQSNGIDDVVKAFRKNLKLAVQNLTRPTSLVYVSMDGVAPLAKLPEQRARREDAAVTAAKRSTFDAQQITPGCIAMTTIEGQVYSLLRELFFTPGKVSSFQSTDFSVILDGSGVEGEGEFKIFRNILRDHVEGDALKGRVTRAILACDADLFLQALLSDVPHLYLFDPFAPCYGSTTIFSVDRWRRNLADDNSSSTGRRLAFDFVLFALMSGSDYAPALRFANYRSLWPTYCEFTKQLRESKRIKLTENSGDSVGTIVKPDEKSIDMRVLRDFFAFYVQEGLADTLREPLQASCDKLDPQGKEERILDYMEHMIWNLNALVTCNVPDLSFSLKKTPSLLELSDFDVIKMQEMLDARLKNQPAKQMGLKCPGVMALMALDRSTDCQEYLAEPLRPLMHELKDPNSSLGSICSDSELIKELTRRIDALPKDSFNLIEKLATFARAPITLNRQITNLPESANFYTMALNHMSTESESGQDVGGSWMRPFVYAIGEEESWKCPLHRMLFGKYRKI